MNKSEHIVQLEKRIKQLEKENQKLKKQNTLFHSDAPTVNAPEDFKPIFDKAEQVVSDYFKKFEVNPSLSKIEVQGQRYVLMRAESLATDFFENIIQLYADRPKEEAIKVGRNMLFDLAHLIGIEDARNFHSKMNLKDPISKMSAGPVHFAYTGWAFVDILPESHPSPDENFYLKYHHPFSFEADSWIKSKKKSDFPVCSMNAGYSSGWCEESFGIELTAVEISCCAKGDKHCTFIMAPPNKIEAYLMLEGMKYKKHKKYDVPLFFERKKSEEKISSALKEKETLLKEIHHRVKNNLQIIISLLKLHADHANDINFSALVAESQNRIISMSLIHEKLYVNTDLSKINLLEYTESLFQKLQSIYNKNQVKLILNIPEDLFFEIDNMIPVGLIMNEALSNSFKYAFPDNAGNITVAMKGKELTISDSGTGFKSSSKKTKGFGMQLMELLSEQISASVKISNHNGTTVSILFN